MATPERCGTRRGEIEGLLRDAAPRALAVVARRCGDFADAEDAVQEAMLEARRQWPAQGAPENPVGWLVHVASRRLTDRMRGESARRGREEAVGGRAGAAAPAPSRRAAGTDDSLALMLHVLPPGADARLGDRAHPARGGRPQHGRDRRRLPRPRGDDGAADQPRQAERSRLAGAVRDAGGEERSERLRSVLHVLYLIFNEGYLSSSGERAGPRRSRRPKRSG